MEHLSQQIRVQAASLMRWITGREALRPQIQQQEQAGPNGVVRQALDPDQALSQQRLAAPWRAGDGASLAQRTFDRQGQQTTPSAGAQSFLGHMTALQQRLDVQRQAEQARQRGGYEQGR
jgi:hypothetical protein